MGPRLFSKLISRIVLHRDQLHYVILMILTHVTKTIWRATAASVLLVETRNCEGPSILSLDHDVMCLLGRVILVAPWHL